MHCSNMTTLLVRQELLSIFPNYMIKKHHQRTAVTQQDIPTTTTLLSQHGVLCFLTNQVQSIRPRQGAH